MALKLVTAAQNEPLLLEEVKQNLRVDHDDDDELLTALLKAAVSYVEGPRGYIGRALIDQTWDFYLDAFPSGGEIEIPLPPLIEISGVFYIDTAGTEQEFDAAGYSVDAASEPGRIVLATTASWPSAKEVPNAVRIRFRAGYLDTSSPPLDDVPHAVKTAMQFRIQADYDGGADADKIRAAADMILQPYRVHKGFA